MSATLAAFLLNLLFNHAPGRRSPYRNRSRTRSRGLSLTPRRPPDPGTTAADGSASRAVAALSAKAVCSRGCERTASRSRHTLPPKKTCTSRMSPSRTVIASTLRYLPPATSSYS